MLRPYPPGVEEDQEVAAGSKNSVAPPGDLDGHWSAGLRSGSWTKDRLITREMDAFVAYRCQQGVGTRRRPDLVLAELRHSCVVAGPSGDPPRKRVHLIPPGRTIWIADVPWLYEKEVHIAVGGAVQSRCAAEEVRRARSRIPALELGSQPPYQFVPEVGQCVDMDGSQVVAVKDLGLN